MTNENEKILEKGTEEKKPINNTIKKTNNNKIKKNNYNAKKNVNNQSGENTKNQNTNKNPNNNDVNKKSRIIGAQKSQETKNQNANQKAVWQSRAGRGGKKKGKKLRIIPLGGLGEVGKNMTVIEYGSEIIVVDGGLMFPEDELLGIDLVIPDYTYLLQNKDKIKGFLITHGHEDHIGAMPYVLKDMDVPVYGSRLTLGLLKGKLQEQRINANLIEVTARQKISIGPFIIEFIRISHSIPDAFALAIHSPVGTIVIVSDFKMDMSPIDNELMDFGSFSRLGEKGVLLLLSDSTNVENEGFTPSERRVGESFDKILANAKGRVIITSFASNVHRIQQAIWSAEKNNRKVAIVGRGMQNVSKIANELGYLMIPKQLQIDIDDIGRYDAEEIMILTTGSQGEPLSGLTRMSQGEHRQVQIIPGDTVVVSASPIPGNERVISRTIDNLFRLGAHVIHERREGIHVSGHASREELKVLLNIVKPKFFMPIHGEYRMLVKHARLAQELGIPEKNTFIMENGNVLEVGRNEAYISGTVPSGRILIDGLGVGDVGNIVLKDRKLLSEGGIFIINIVVNKNNGKITLGPEIFSRGFIFEKEYEHIIEEAREKIISICARNEEQGKIDWNAARNQLRNNLGRFLFDQTGRRPIVLPIITEV